MAEGKRDTEWYDDLCILYQKTKIPELRNVLWEQVKLLIYSKIREFVNEKKSSILKKDPDLIQKLYQESFFIFQKACDIWDPLKKTKFLTFFGDIFDQEILNIIRLDLYHRKRDKKIKTRLVDETPIETPPEQENIEKEELFEKIREMFETYSFDNEIERDVIYTIIYGIPGDWTRLRKKSQLSIANFAKFRQKTVSKIKKYILDNCDDRMKDILKEILNEK